ncbi:MAG: esterase family protein [Lewinellaceae bacterium]|nr:esterase family protein [Lewinellaceae bacterium]
MKIWTPPTRSVRNWLSGNKVTIHPIREWHSAALGRAVDIDIYLPPGYHPGIRRYYSLLLLNDGQDLPYVRLQQTLERLYQNKDIPHLIAVGIHAGKNRIREYGTASQADYKGRGDLAAAHQEFVRSELLPHLYRHYPLKDDPRHMAYAGFSLGGLSAFDVAWANPQLFGTAGVFSGALWWRSHAVRPEDPDADRIAHTLVLNSSDRPNSQRFWFQAGTKDEEEDRNNNGVIDAIDDTLHLIECLKTKGYPDEQLQYLEMEGGEHNPATWGEAMPDFLAWSFRAPGYQY